MDAAGDKLARDIGAGEFARTPGYQVADTGLVIAPRRNLAREVVAEHGLQFGKAGETEMLGKAHHGAGLHAALARHVLDAFKPDVVAVFFDMQRNRLELLAQVRVGSGDALNQLVGAGG